MKTTTKKRLTKKRLAESSMEELVWDLWSSYSESDVDGVCGVLPCWGPYSDENGEDIDQDKARETLKETIRNKSHLSESALDDVLFSIEALRERTSYDERWVAKNVKDWTIILWDDQKSQ